MHIEVTIGLNFMLSLLYNKLPRRRVNMLGEELEKNFKLKFQGHWFSEKPYKDSGYRCFKITTDFIDTLLLNAANSCGMDIQEILKNLPTYFILWIDPGEVSFRLIEKGPIKVIYEDENRSKLRFKRIDNGITNKNFIYRNHHHHHKSINDSILLNDDECIDCDDNDECTCEINLENINYENFTTNTSSSGEITNELQQNRGFNPDAEIFKPIIISNSQSSTSLANNNINNNNNNNKIYKTNLFNSTQNLFLTNSGGQEINSSQIIGSGQSFQSHKNLFNNNSNTDQLSSSFNSITLSKSISPSLWSSNLPSLSIPISINANTATSINNNDMCTTPIQNSIGSISPTTPIPASPSVSPFTPSKSPISTTNASLFTTASFAQTKFGSTKSKNANKRQQKMLPSEFSAYIKQKAQMQQMQKGGGVSVKQPLHYTLSAPSPQIQTYNTTNNSLLTSSLNKYTNQLDLNENTLLAAQNSLERSFSTPSNHDLQSLRQLNLQNHHHANSQNNNSLFNFDTISFETATASSSSPLSPQLNGLNDFNKNYLNPGKTSSSSSDSSSVGSSFLSDSISPPLPLQSVSLPSTRTTNRISLANSLVAGLANIAAQHNQASTNVFASASEAFNNSLPTISDANAFLHSSMPNTNSMFRSRPNTLSFTQLQAEEQEEAQFLNNYVAEIMENNDFLNHQSSLYDQINNNTSPFDQNKLFSEQQSLSSSSSSSFSVSPSSFTNFIQKNELNANSTTIKQQTVTASTSATTTITESTSSTSTTSSSNSFQNQLLLAN